MKKFLVISFSLLLTSTISKAQTVISQFTWDSNPVTQADVGPNATSVSSSATSDINGVGGTNGLNPGSPKADINMDIPGSPTFDVQGIDISIDFQREESRGDFVSRGNNLVMGMNGGNLSVTFRTEDGSGSYININSGNVYSIPNDDVFRTYRFFYLPGSGVAELQVDGATVWSYAGTPGLTLYWVGAGNLRVGNLMDASGSNETVFDNLIIASVMNNPLPVTLTAFTVTPKLDHVAIDWSTATEQDNDYFEILRSADGKEFRSIAKIKGQGYSQKTTDYRFLDQSPLAGISYYRLKQVDNNGAAELYDIESVQLEKEDQFINVYPNPVRKGIVKVETNYDVGSFVLYDQFGKLCLQKQVGNNTHSYLISVDQLPSGIYILEVRNDRQAIRKKLILQ